MSSTIFLPDFAHFLKWISWSSLTLRYENVPAKPQRLKTLIFQTLFFNITKNCWVKIQFQHRDKLYNWKKSSKWLMRLQTETHPCLFQNSQVRITKLQCFNCNSLRSSKRGKNGEMTHQLRNMFCFFEQVMQKGVKKATSIVAPFVEKNKSICP